MIAMLEGERPVAGIYAFRVQDTVQAYTMSFDEELSHLAPGIVLTSALIEHCIGEGVTRFDFLEGPEEYKFDWCDSVRDNIRFVVYGQTAAAKAERIKAASGAAAINIARRLIPEKAREEILKGLAWRQAEKSRRDTE